MRFPSIDQLPPLTAAETADWYYPAYEHRPYTPYFANQVIDLITVEEHLLRHLKYLRTNGNTGELIVDLQSHGALSLPRWELELAGRQYVSVNEASSFRVTLAAEAQLQNEDGTAAVTFSGDWGSRLSDFGQLIHHLLPYITTIQLVTNHDQVVFTVPK
jgi:hypothetical protein